MADTKKPTQHTEPKRGQPVEIPVPNKTDVQRNLLKIAKKSPPGKPAGNKEA